MPRVLRIINRLNLGGPTFNASYLTRYMEPEYETVLVSGMKDDSEASSAFIPERLGIEPRYVKHMHRSLHPAKDFQAYRELRTLIRAYKPDIVHTHAAKPGTIGRLAALHEKVPVVLHTFHGHVFHSYFGPLKTRFFIEIERYLARNSSGIIAISPAQKNELSMDFGIAKPENIHVVPLGFDLDRFRAGREEKRASFRKQYGLRDEDVAVGIVGRLVPIKNHALFLKAFHRSWTHWNAQHAIESAQPSFREARPTSGTSTLVPDPSDPAKAPPRFLAFIIGDGESRDAVEESCRALDLPFAASHDKSQKLPPFGAAVIFTSWIKDVDRAFAGLDVLALSSLNEGTPVSLIEALAAGKPCVSTNVGGISDVLPEAYHDFLVDKEDEQGFAEALNRLVGDFALRRELGRIGEGDVFERYGYQRLVQDMRALYGKLLAKPS
jgi:glycosyltransferase involved in cell wall biosynthesis